ncbi:hypothetical protein UC34_08190 [Pandoraea vervacti]|uniref:Uncharacterized protein n=1 Tax=Pandoraea vervacti TaxID=656178 RepID=A0ABN4FN58_9BURK|nr:hypothetical protein UC34_08190 [Pandoraea vervacti]
MKNASPGATQYGNRRTNRKISPMRAAFVRVAWRDAPFGELGRGRFVCDVFYLSEYSFCQANQAAFAFVTITTCDIV